jgi:hypothetical protein
MIEHVRSHHHSSRTPIRIERWPVESLGEVPFMPETTPAEASEVIVVPGFDQFG